jgi:hypothetical protein
VEGVMSDIFAEIKPGEIEKIRNFDKDFQDIFKQAKKEVQERENQKWDATKKAKRRWKIIK